MSVGAGGSAPNRDDLKYVIQSMQHVTTLKSAIRELCKIRKDHSLWWWAQTFGGRGGGSSHPSPLTPPTGYGPAHTFASSSPMCITWKRRKLGSKQAHRAIHCPRVHGLTALSGFWMLIED